MPFAADTKVRVCLALGLPLTAPFYLQRVQEALDQVETYGGEAAVLLVTQYLEQYETAETSLNTGASGQGLIKADVLEWSPGGQTAGFESEMSRLRNLLMDVLSLHDLLPDNRARSGRVQITRG